MQKLKADAIFDGYGFRSSDSVLVLEDDGTVIDIVSSDAAGSDVQVLNGILTPGFVNTHCHLELSHMKGWLPEATGLVPFLIGVSRQRKAGDQEIVAGMEKALQELTESGVVAVGDICNTSHSIAVKAGSPLRWYNFIEVFASDSRMAHQRMQHAETVLQQFREQLPQHPAAPAPHAPYSISPPLFRLLQTAIGASITTIHNQESADENELFLCGTGAFLQLYAALNNGVEPFWPTGKTSLQTWLPQLPLPSRILLVHNVHTSAEDIAYAAALTARQGQQLYYCICLRANHYIQRATPPMPMLMQAGCKITIGTDSLASNYSLRMTDELMALQQTFGKEVKLENLLTWATINGAEALGMEDTLGSFSPGKQPGVLLLQHLHDHNFTTQTKVKRIA